MCMHTQCSYIMCKAWEGGRCQKIWTQGTLFSATDLLPILYVHNIYRVHFNFGRVYISRILAFNNFHVLIFVDGHVLPLHKSPI